MEYNEATTQLFLVFNEVWEQTCGKKIIDYDHSIVSTFLITEEKISIPLPLGGFFPEPQHILKARMIESLLKQGLFKKAFWQMFDSIVNDLLPENALMLSFYESEGSLQSSQEQWRNKITKRIYHILNELNDREQVLYVVPKYISIAKHTSNANRFVISFEQKLLQLLR